MNTGYADKYNSDLLKNLNSNYACSLIPSKIPLQQKKPNLNDASIYCLTTNGEEFSDVDVKSPSNNNTVNNATGESDYYIYKLQAHNLTMQL